ncbi:conserved hypothetical protein [Streptococcus equi subsp. zooepidemicus]|uniref:Uncharacterized protein n=1 Tax=Streptococcus equi subsp. zooepidemicus (strain H70) TaxID=553483 RepID=C0MF80_STRS7|nr:hypothetical protein Q426_10195 [Streptococcus equi subsp. zooepidemicus CY]CAW97886.1 conserved hypothetical protein [Streptococcus equi subsp. zooepidemicus]
MWAEVNRLFDSGRSYHIVVVFADLFSVPARSAYFLK